ncbi:hypothetical protein Hanom_Chr14g01248251 [Helianthus anomalus]
MEVQKVVEGSEKTKEAVEIEKSHDEFEADKVSFLDNNNNNNIVNNNQGKDYSGLSSQEEGEPVCHSGGALDTKSVRNSLGNDVYFFNSVNQHNGIKKGLSKSGPGTGPKPKQGGLVRFREKGPKKGSEKTGLLILT